MAARAREPVDDSALLLTLSLVEAHPEDLCGRYSGDRHFIRQGARGNIPREENVDGGAAPLGGDLERDGLGSPAVLQWRGMHRGAPGLDGLFESETEAQQSCVLQRSPEQLESGGKP